MERIFFVMFNVSVISPHCLALTVEKNASFKVSAKIETGCELSYSDQEMNFGRHAATSQEKIKSSIINNSSTWNIRCTEKLPINISIDNGQNFLDDSRHMKNMSSSDYIPYKLYTSDRLNIEYIAGHKYELNSTTSLSSILNFSIHGIANLNNNNQPKLTGIYKDTVSLLITW